MNKKLLGYLGFLSILAPFGVYLAAMRDNKAYLAFLGFLGFMGFFTYLNTDPDKKWANYTKKEKVGTVLLFLMAAVFIIATLTMLLYMIK